MRPDGTGRLSGSGKLRVFWRIFRNYMCRFKPALIAFFCFAAAAVACSVLVPRFLGLATTRIFDDVMAIARGTAAGVDFPYLVRIALILLVLYAVSAACQYMQGRLMTRITNRSTYFIRQDIASKLNRLPLSYFENRDRSGVLSLVTNDADVIAFSLNQVVTQVINTALALTGITVIMFFMNWLLALLVVAALPLCLLASHLAGCADQQRFSDLQSSLSDMTAHVSDVYLLQDMLRSGKGRGPQLRRFDRINERIYRSSWRAQFASGALLPAVSAISSFTYIAVCVLGSLMAVRGILTVGEIQAFIQYVRSFTQPVTQLATIRASVEHILAAASRIFAFLDSPEQPAVSGAGHTAALKGAVEFQDVCVQDESGRPLLSGISFRVPAGSAVAVAGRHGSGKSLLLRTLAGLYPAASGHILIDGCDLTSLSAAERRETFAAAFQSPWLQAETIASNIRYGVPDAGPEKVQEAARRVGADVLARSHAGSYDEMLSERHRNLARGEAELLQLARAALTGARISILDDAVQNVDPLTRLRALDAFRKPADGTVFIATGRLADLRRADYVILLHQGKIAAAGTLAEVTAAEAFRALFGAPEDPPD